MTAPLFRHAVMLQKFINLAITKTHYTADEICRSSSIRQPDCTADVSKPWCALIDSPKFIKMHLNRSKTSSILALIFEGRGTLYSVQHDSMQNATELDTRFENSNIVDVYVNPFAGVGKDLVGSGKLLEGGGGDAELGELFRVALEGKPAVGGVDLFGGAVAATGSGKLLEGGGGDAELGELVRVVLAEGKPVVGGADLVGGAVAAKPQHLVLAPLPQQHHNKFRTTKWRAELPSVLSTFDIAFRASGIVVGNGEYILTCNHVVSKDDSYAFVNEDNVKLRVTGYASRVIVETNCMPKIRVAKIVWADKMHDLACLRLDDGLLPLPSVKFCPYDVKQGMDVICMSALHGRENTLNAGIISHPLRMDESVSALVIHHTIDLGSGASGAGLLTNSGFLCGLHYGHRRDTMLALSTPQLVAFFKAALVEDSMGSPNMISGLHVEEVLEVDNGENTGVSITSSHAYLLPCSIASSVMADNPFGVIYRHATR
ncbi:hypothetical protein RJ639_034793 [Escallonia herrerae]|uniref:Serine protease n=1 Tax=Escallonia herrerae TaxID=1293975 RepID=A0AA88X288_9ASTE|nr:hypothetical protein RJ639_034793 [Escallonia herrerae]